MFSRKSVALIDRVIYWPRPECIYLSVFCFAVQISLGRDIPTKKHATLHFSKWKTNVSFFPCNCVIEQGLLLFPHFTLLVKNKSLKNNELSLHQVLIHSPFCTTFVTTRLPSEWKHETLLPQEKHYCT